MKSTRRLTAAALAAATTAVLMWGPTAILARDHVQRARLRRISSVIRGAWLSRMTAVHRRSRRYSP